MNDGELEKLDEQAANHWWYASRRRLLESELVRARCRPAETRILDLASASAHTLQACSAFGRAYGIDLGASAVALAARKGIRTVVQGDVQAIPFADESFEVVTALDVFEHLPDDALCLREIRRVLVPGGTLIFNVPAFMLLFSDHDRAFSHLRRYRRADLLRTIGSAGLEPGFASYWSCAAFPGVFLGRRVLGANRGKSGEVRSDFHMALPRPIEVVLDTATALEAKWVSRRRRLPFGVSLFGQARKPA